jgi:hypothetical protein
MTPFVPSQSAENKPVARDLRDLFNKFQFPDKINSYNPLKPFGFARND